MSTLEELKRRLKERFESQETSLKPHVLPAAIDQTIQHHYERYEQPVIVREVHNVEVQQIVQPIEEDEEVETEHQETVRASIYREELHDLTQDDRDTRDQNRQNMDVARQKVLTDTHNDVALDPIVEESSFRYVLKEIQPVFSKRKLYRHLMTEFIPIFEKHMHICNV